MKYIGFSQSQAFYRVFQKRTFHYIGWEQENNDFYDIRRLKKSFREGPNFTSPFVLKISSCKGYTKGSIMIYGKKNQNDEESFIFIGDSVPTSFALNCPFSNYNYLLYSLQKAINLVKKHNINYLIWSHLNRRDGVFKEGKEEVINFLEKEISNLKKKMMQIKKAYKKGTAQGLEGKDLIGYIISNSIRGGINKWAIYNDMDNILSKLIKEEINFRGRGIQEYITTMNLISIINNYIKSINVIK